MKAEAVRIIRRADMDIPKYATGESDVWTPALIKSALVDAYRVLGDTTDRVGPSKLRGFWPEYAANFADIMALAEIEQIKTKAPRRQRTSVEIKHMEMVLLGWRDAQGTDHSAWLNGSLMNYERARKCLIASTMCKIYHVKIKDLCQRNQWPISTFKRHRDFAAGQIALKLCHLNVEVWYA